jgi:thymidylate synthase (FAD)
MKETTYKTFNGEGFVTLIDYMGDDNRVVDAARVSYDKKASEYSEEQNERLLDYLIRHHHTSPFEHVVFSFRVKAPIIAWWHILRHRMASYNLTSYRYGEYKEDFYHIPADGWRTQDTKNKQASSGTLDDKEGRFLSHIVNEHFETCRSLYESLLAKGVSRELARIVLPALAMMQEGIITLNLHSFANLCRLRCDDAAQQEVREVVSAMRFLASEELTKISKILFA